jgi:predicted Zn-dependent peptidase
MKKWLLMVSAGICISSVPFAQTKQIQFEKYTLPNGLKVILHQDKSAPVVAVSALYHVGSKNEDTARTGFAHFFEHLMFEGSEYIKRGDFDKYVSNAGGYNNANTTQDRTYYFELFPSNQFALGLWLESERMLHAKIEDIGVNTQKEVVKEEKRQRVDNQPYGSIIGNVFSRAFKVHPYRWQPIGSLEHLSRAKLQDFKDFYAKFYVPNNCVLSVAGDIDIEATKKVINDYFTSIPKGTIEIPRASVVEPALSGEVRDVIEDNIQLPAVIQAYRAPKQGSDEYYAFNVLSTILSGGSSSRLNKTIVDQKQLAVGAGAFNYALEDAGLFIIYGIANAGVKPDVLETNLDSIISAVKTTLVGEREFQKVKNQTTTEFVTRNATMQGIAETLANYEVYFGDANLINTELNKFNKVTREDLLSVAKKYLNKDNRVVLYYVPKGSKK